MTVVLTVDAETGRLARKLAEVTGKALPDVVKAAILAEAAKEGIAMPAPPRRKTAEEKLAAMIAITDVFAHLPVLDARSADEIIGYDEHGVPR